MNNLSKDVPKSTASTEGDSTSHNGLNQFFHKTLNPRPQLQDTHTPKHATYTPAFHLRNQLPTLSMCEYSDSNQPSLGLLLYTFHILGPYDNWSIGSRLGSLSRT